MEQMGLGRANRRRERMDRQTERPTGRLPAAAGACGGRRPRSKRRARNQGAGTGRRSARNISVRGWGVRKRGWTSFLLKVRSSPLAIRHSLSEARRAKSKQPKAKSPTPKARDAIGAGLGCDEDLLGYLVLSSSLLVLRCWFLVVSSPLPVVGRPGNRKRRTKNQPRRAKSHVGRSGLGRRCE